MKKKSLLPPSVCFAVVLGVAALFGGSASAAQATSASSGGSWWDDVKAQFVLNFVEKDRWRSLLEGLGNTLRITFFAALLGIAIGIVIAAIRTTFDNNKENMKHSKSIGYYVLGFFNAICKIYLTVIRGTPVVVQLLIIYFIIFADRKSVV